MKRLYNFRFKNILILFSICLLWSINIIAQENHEIPNFSHQRGFYNSPFELTITGASTNFKIYYTLNGTDPAKSSLRFESDSDVTIQINPYDTTGRGIAPAVCVRAVLFSTEENIYGKTVTQTYLFPNDIISLSPDNIKPSKLWPEPNATTGFQEINYGLDPEVYNDSDYKDEIQEAFTAIPSISMVTDLKNLFDPDTGIYMNGLKHGRAWERWGSIELLNPDGSEGFQANTGIRIRGAWARRGLNSKHAFRFFFRSEYGDSKLRYPLFGDEGVDEFDKIDLRTSQNYSWAYEPHGGDGRRNTFLRDIFIRDIQKAMQQPYTRSRYYHLYINGVYWGLYMTQERSEAAYASSYLGGDREDYDVVKILVGETLNQYIIEATDGDLDAYKRLWTAATIGFISDASYYEVQGKNPDGTINPDFERLLDVDNLIDYQIALFYSGDPDGPQIPNNFYGVYNRVNPDGFKFFRHDCEHSLMTLDVNVSGPYNNGTSFRTFNPQWLHERLSDNSKYRQRFADRLHNYCFNNGILSPEVLLERFNERKQVIEIPIIAESARWGDAKNTIPRTKNKDWVKEVNFLINEIIPNRTQVLLNQMQSKGLQITSNSPKFNVSDGSYKKGKRVSISSDRGTIFYTLDGSDPMIPSDIDQYDLETIVPLDATKHVLVSSKANSGWDNKLTYKIDDWLVCSGTPGGIGYEKESGYEKYITLDVGDLLYKDNPNALDAARFRTVFTLTQEQIDNIDLLIIKALYDDGFVAYFNGNKFENFSINSPLNVSPRYSAVKSHEAIEFEYFDISHLKNHLVAGENLLAVMAYNDSSGSSDFLIHIELLAGNQTEFEANVSEKAIQYTGMISLDKSTQITARVYDNGTWSPLKRVNLFVPEEYDGIKITEIHYHPLDSETMNDKEYEFIELKYVGENNLDISGLQFISGIDYTFPNGSVIEPEQIIVLASNSDAFSERYNFSADGEYSGYLNNGGEIIRMQKSDGDTILTLKYGDSFPWPKSADGDGYSITPKNKAALLNQNDATNWIASKDIHGNPGKELVYTEVNESKAIFPQEYLLLQNYPNPFNPSTVISYYIPENSFVKIRIYDLLGREVSTLVSKDQKTGTYEIKFDATDLSSGIYFYSLQSKNYFNTKKMLLIK